VQKMFLSTAAALLLAGCSIRGGLVRDSVTSVVLDGPDFRYAKVDLQATKTRGSIFCVFGLPPADLYRQLMASLHAQAQLRPNQI
jgi:hypothetical protein